MIKLLIFLIFIISCSKDSKIIEINDQRIKIEVSDLKFEEVDNVSWAVGRSKITVLSKGLQLLINLPSLSKEDLNLISKKYKFDSWIYEVYKNKNGYKQILNSFYIPFVKNRGEFSHSVEKNGVYLMYSSVYPSPSFEKFNCPAFGHDKFLESYDIEKSYGVESTQYLKISKFTSKRYNGAPEKAHYSLNKVNVGKYMKGEYVIRIALYDQENKKTVSNFISYTTKLNVYNETQRVVSGCTGVKEKIPEIKNPNGKFKFGRD